MSENVDTICNIKNNFTHLIKCVMNIKVGILKTGIKKTWLGYKDSNLGMAESESAALPLGYTPTVAGAGSGI